MSEAERIKWEQVLMGRYRNSFENIRRESDYAPHGKDRPNKGKKKPSRKGTLPTTLYLNVENAAAASLRTKKLDGSLLHLNLKECKVRAKAADLRERDWPEEEIKALVAHADKIISESQPRSVYDFFKCQSTSTSQPEETPPVTLDEGATTEDLEPEELPQKSMSTGSGEYLVQLASFFSLPKNLVVLLGEWFRRDTTLNQAAKGVVSQLMDLDADKSVADNRSWAWAVSQFKDQNISYEREKKSCAEELGRLGEIVLRKENLRQQRLSWLEERRQTDLLNQEVEEASGNSLKAVLALKDISHSLRRTLNRRLQNTYKESEKTELRTFNIGLTWLTAMENIEDEFEGKDISLWKLREMTISGFPLKFYRQVYDLFALHRRQNSEFVPIDELLMATESPRGMKRRCLSAIKAHLPVSLLHCGPKFVMIDNEMLINSTPDLMVKIITLESMSPAKKYNIQEKVAKKARPGTKHERRRKCFHEVHPEVLDAAKEIIMSDGVEADKRRRTELGLSRITISCLQERLREMMPAGTPVPSYNTLRRCVFRV